MQKEDKDHPLAAYEGHPCFLDLDELSKAGEEDQIFNFHIMSRDFKKHIVTFVSRRWRFAKLFTTEKLP